MLCPSCRHLVSLHEEGPCAAAVIRRSEDDPRPDFTYLKDSEVWKIPGYRVCGCEG